MSSQLHTLAATYLFGGRPGGKSTAGRRLMAFGVIAAPIIVIAGISYLKLREELTTAVWARREAIASLSASILKEKFDRLMDVSVSLATRVRFRDLVAAEKWSEAAQVLADIPKDLPYIERVFLASTEGTLQADTPAMPEMHGKNFAHRDWYKGVAAEWKPYLSEVYVRQAEPQYKVLAVAAPIRKPDGSPAGILVVQVRADTLFQWTADIDIGTGGFVYVVDQRGHIASHPKYTSANALIDFSSVPVVGRALSGKSGTELTYNPIEVEECVTAFTSVPGYGWAVIAQQPAQLAYTPRDNSLFFLLVIYAFIFAFTCALAYLIVGTLEQSRSLQQSLKQNVDGLEAANKELEAFSYSVSHDLRAPLRSIEGFSRILQEDYHDKIDAAGKDSLQRVRAAALRMSQLIDDMLNLSRVSRQEVVSQPVDLSAMVRGIVAELQRADPERQVQVEVADGAVVRGDPRLLRILLENLLSNAWKFTGKTASARIEFGRAPQNNRSAAAFFVRDNGAGFDMAYSNKLFAPFQRLHTATEFSGTGVGLATVQRVALKHGGKVWAEGKVDGGATFYFAL